jgi:hypothetical protein
LTIPWSQLLDLGLSDVGDYRIAVKAINGDGLSATATADVDVKYGAPTVTLTSANGSNTTTAGTPFTVDFSAIWPAPVEQALEWIVNWGDGSAPEVFGATTTSATHTYLTTGVAAITATVVDKDNKNGTTSNPLNLNVSPGQLNPGGPYTINEGDSLTVTGSAAGDPTGYTWHIGTGVYNTTTPTVTLTWAQLEADGLGTDNGGSPYVLSFGATYTDFSDSLTQTATASVKLSVDPTAPTFTSVTNTGPVQQDQDATVTITGATAVSSEEAQTLEYRIFIPGVFDTGFQPFSQTTGPTNVPGTFSATVPGQYLMQVGQQLVDVEVRDAEGLVVDGNTLITVNKVPPTLTATGAATSNEGATYTLNLTETDPVSSEVIESWDVNWGDGTVSHYVVNPAAPNSAIAPTHVYLDNGSYTITETATDGDAVTYQDSPVSVQVLNVAPSLQNVAVTSPIDENGFANLSGRISDPGILDNFVLTVNWGDAGAGQPPDIVTYNLAAGTLNFDVSHQFLSPGNYTVSTFVTDKDGGVSPTTALALQVNDLPPVLSTLAVQPAQTYEGGRVVTVSGSYTDPGTLDTQTVTINFGDGTVMSSTDPDTTIVINTVNRTFTATHLYLDNPPVGTPGSAYTISAVVTDNYGLSSNTETAKVEVDNVAPIFVGLALNGTQGASPVNGQIPSTITINEEGVVTIVGSFRDPGILDTETVSINWNDPGVAPQLVTATRDPNDPTLWLFTASHEYVRDNPGGVYMPVREISVTATDKDGGTSTVDAKITIAHIEPVIDSLILNPPTILANGVVVLTGHITDSGLHPVADIVIDWGDGSAPATLADSEISYDALTNTFTAEHQYLNTGVSGLHVDLIRVSMTDDDTGFASANVPIQIMVITSADFGGFASFINLQGPTGAGLPAPAEIPQFQFQSTGYTPYDVLDGGRPVLPLHAEQGSPVELPLNFADLGGADLSNIEIDWGDGNVQSLNNPGNGSVDVAHAYPHIVGDDEIATGALSPSGSDDSSGTEVVVKAFRKGINGRKELTSITHYRIELDGVAPRVDKFSLNRVDGADGDVDTLDGRIAYPALPNSVAVSVTWSDGTTSDGVIELKNGEFWFSAVRNYAGKAPSSLVSLQFINTTNSKIVGSFAIKPQSTTLDPVSSPIQGPASNQRHGEVIPAHRSNHALALHAPGGAAVTKSDLALMFGAGALAVGGGLQKATARPGVGDQAGDASPIVAQPSLWLDRSLAKAVRRQKARSTDQEPTAQPAVAATDPGWLATPYRVPAAASAEGMDGLGGWHEVDDWLVASDQSAVRPADAADWLIVRE